MELQNYERELKYLIKNNLTFEKILDLFARHGYLIIEKRNKKKDEIYYDTASMSYIKAGDVIRSTKHYNSDGTYSHYMYKKNSSNPGKPYVSKYEYGSGCYGSIMEFIQQCGINSADKFSEVLYATITRKTFVAQKDSYKLLISFDNTDYRKEGFPNISEKMLEIEDWTTPYTLEAENSSFDAHLLDIHEIVMTDSEMSLLLTKESKPYRGLSLLSVL